MDLFFWFVRDEPELPRSGSENWPERLRSWLSLVRTNERFVNAEGRIADLSDLTAEDYVTSDPLDLDRLSE